MMKNGTRRELFRAAGRVLRSGPGRQVMRLGVWFLGSFALAAGSLQGCFQPLALGLLCAGRGGAGAAAAALGGVAGYLWFWGGAGWQAVVWMTAGLAVSLGLGDRGISSRQKLLLPACAAVIVAGGGVLFLYRYADDTPVDIYLIRVGLSLASTLVFRAWLERRGSWADWLAQGLLVLALAQIRALGLNLGHIAAGYLGSQGALASAYR